MKKILFLFILFARIVQAKFFSIDADTLVSLQKKGIVVIDIRRESEWRETGIIPGAKTITFFDEKGNFDFVKWMSEFTKYVKNKHQAFILVCAHSNRTKVLGKFLSDMMKLDRVYELEGGIIYGWIDKKRKTVKYK